MSNTNQTHAQTLNGKIALVTGGSRGIGAAIAKRLAAAGAEVTLTFSASPDKAEAVVKEITAAGGKAHAVKADQSDARQVTGMVNDVAKKHGRIDILVNNAGVAEFAHVEAAPDEAFLAKQYAVNVIGVAAAVRAVVPHMQAGGRIVSIGSVVGERVPFAGAGDYAATKGAVAMYTRAWARDLGPKGITVNVVQPGPIATDMNPDEGDMAVMMKSGIPLGRYGQPAEVAAAVAFLVSPEASYVSGAALNVDGGLLA